MDGWVFGGQAGYNWQFNKNWVFGIEGDIDATGQDGTATLGPITSGNGSYAAPRRSRAADDHNDDHGDGLP